MADFKVAHLVTQLLRLFGAEDQPVEVYEKLLLRNINSQTSSHLLPPGAVKKLAQSCKNPKEFLSKYDGLKATKGKDIDSLIVLLSKISSDNVTKQNLSKIFDKKDAPASTSSGMSANDLLLLKDRLQKETVASPPSKLSISAVSNSITKKKQSSIQAPPIPSWINTRPYLTMNFVVDSLSISQANPLGALPLSAQENNLIEDLLFCLEGIEGEYIHCQERQVNQTHSNFNLDSSIDISLRELTNRILPLCSNYSTVVKFIEERSQFHHGQVNQALCAAMRNLVKDYFVLIAQLEHQHRQGLLTLQKMWFYLQPTMSTMDTLASIVKTIVVGNCRGGSVLSLLHNKTSFSSGDTKVQELCLHLTQAASVPYFQILQKWIYKGLICDPYVEFLVEDNEIIQKEHLLADYSDDFWEKRYTICRERIPTFLDKVSDTILRTGKYLNVIRQCGKKLQCPNAEKLSYSIRERQCIDSIEKAYRHSSRELLQYLMKDKDLIGILRSVKHYFLLDQGDFIVQFMDMAEEELKKNIDYIIPTRLESLVELALRTSSANHDNYKDNLKVELLPYDIVFQMSKILTIETEEEDEFKTPSDLKLSGLEAFSFDYDVKWPLSLILNRKAIACYQMLFRHLFLSKHVERMLCNIWMNNKVARSFPIVSSRQYMSVFALCARMLYFVQNMEYYMMLEVLEPNWNTFVLQMKSVANVDDLLKCHTDFLDVCLKDCMLTNPQLLGLVNGIMKTCLTFCKLYLSNYTISADGSIVVSIATIPEESPSNDDFQNAMDNATGKKYSSLSALVEAYDEEFTSLIIQLLDYLQDLSSDNYNSKLINMLYRVDFNGYYSNLTDKQKPTL